MFKPFYSKAGHIIYCADALELMPHLPSRSAGMLLTDMPYGCNYEDRKRRKMINDHKSFDPTPYLLSCLRILKQGSRGIVFADSEALALIKSVHDISDVRRMIWVKDKTLPRKRTVLPNVEYAFFFIKGKNKRDVNAVHIPEAIVYPRPRGGDERFHQAQKPVGLLQQYITVASNPGDTVLDCCAGSGSIAVAAHLAGRLSWSIEKDPDYCDIAARRLDYAIATGKAIENKKELDRQGCLCSDCLLSSVETHVDSIMQLPDGTKFYVLAPLTGDIQRLLTKVRTMGFVYVMVNGVVIRLDGDLDFVTDKHSVELVVDRLFMRNNVRPRLSESAANAFQIGNGVFSILQENGSRTVFGR